MSTRSEALAARLEQGARLLEAVALGLSDADWVRRGGSDKRPLGVVIHHVASVYPVEIALAQTIARGDRMTGVTMADINAMNAEHARTSEGVTREQVIEAIRKNSAEAAEAIRRLTDEQLDRAIPASLYGDAPVTAQFVLEDHAIRHSWHHMDAIRRLLASRPLRAAS